MTQTEWQDIIAPASLLQKTAVHAGQNYLCKQIACPEVKGQDDFPSPDLRTEPALGVPYPWTQLTMEKKIFVFLCSIYSVFILLVLLSCT